MQGHSGVHPRERRPNLRQRQGIQTMYRATCLENGEGETTYGSMRARVRFETVSCTHSFGLGNFSMALNYFVLTVQ